MTNGSRRDGTTTLPPLPKSGNHFPPPNVQSSRERRRSQHVRIPTLVHPVRPLLASRAAGLDCLPLHLAAPAPVPHHRRRRAWRLGGNFPRHHAALPPAGRTVPRLRDDALTILHRHRL